MGNTRTLQENVALIREINTLRQQIDILKRERQQQRLNVSKLRSSGRGAGVSTGTAGASEDKGGAASPGSAGGKGSTETSEFEANKTKMEELRRQLETKKSRLGIDPTATAPVATAATGDA